MAEQIRTCVDWTFANRCVRWQWLRLWRPVSISKSTKIFHMSCVWRCGATKRRARLFFSRVDRHHDRWQGSMLLLSGFPGLIPPNSKLVLYVPDAFVSSRHPSCIDLRQALPPNHLLPYFCPTLVLTRTRLDLAWSSSRQSTELYKRQESLASSSAMIFKWFANNSCKACLLYSPNGNFLCAVGF